MGQAPRDRSLTVAALIGVASSPIRATTVREWSSAEAAILSCMMVLQVSQEGGAGGEGGIDIGGVHSFVRMVAEPAG